MLIKVSTVVPEGIQYRMYLEVELLWCLQDKSGASEEGPGCMIGSLGCPAAYTECWLVDEPLGLKLRKESLSDEVKLQWGMLIVR